MDSLFKCMDSGTIKQIEDIGFKKCTFDNECDTCNDPKLGTFARDQSGYEYDDDWYWMCGKCILKEIKTHSHKTNAQLLYHFDQLDKPILPF